jgi:hypothetical protein
MAMCMLKFKMRMVVCIGPAIIGPAIIGAAKIGSATENDSLWNSHPET